MKKAERIYLAPPNVDVAELQQMQHALHSGWVAPAGPAIDDFEKLIASFYPEKAVVALNSGTAALHLSLRMVGIAAGDLVAIASLNFAACANVILYEQGIPIFLDSEPTTWNLDPNLLESLARKKKIKAVIVTHLYGMPAQISDIRNICDKYDMLLIEDGAESLGAKVGDRHVGTWGDYAVLSFNGNKIITTSGGGALICDLKEKSRIVHLATQANSGIFGYDHQEVGYNYRMSNILAAMGQAQWRKLDGFLQKKREINDRYREHLADQFLFLPSKENRISNHWLTTATLKNKEASVLDLIHYLDAKEIESRRIWKPLHLHEAYNKYDFYGTGICEDIYAHGICLPSGTSLSTSDQDKVIAAIHSWISKQKAF